MRITKTFDGELEVKDAGLVAASAAAQVDSADKIIDIGSGYVEADLVVDVTAIEIADNDEKYTIYVEGSNSETFASGIVPLASLELGAKEVIDGDTDSGTGRYVLPFTNERNGTLYRYVRAYTLISGSIATGINYSAFIAKK